MGGGGVGSPLLSALEGNALGWLPLRRRGSGPPPGPAPPPAPRGPPPGAAAPPPTPPACWPRGTPGSAAAANGRGRPRGAGGSAGVSQPSLWPLREALFGVHFRGSHPTQPCVPALNPEPGNLSNTPGGSGRVGFSRRSPCPEQTDALALSMFPLPPSSATGSGSLLCTTVKLHPVLQLIGHCWTKDGAHSKNKSNQCRNAIMPFARLPAPTHTGMPCVLPCQGS